MRTLYEKYSATAIQILLIIFLTSGIWSCTRKVYIPVQSVKVEYKDRIQKDSIYMLDSVRIIQRNDTVFLTRWRTELKYRTLRDSIHVNDTIRESYEVEKIVKVEKELTWYEQICVKFFTWLLIAIAGYFAVTYRKKLWGLIMWVIKKIV